MSVVSVTDAIGSLGEFMPISHQLQLLKLKTEGRSAHKDNNPKTTIPNKNKFRALEHIAVSKKKTGNPLLQVIRSRTKRGLSLGESCVSRNQTAVQSSISKSLNKTDNCFFVKKDFLKNNEGFQKQKLSKEHHLLKSILKTHEYENKYKGTDLYDDSYKRLYAGFKKIEIRPIIEKRVLDTTQGEDQKLQQEGKKAEPVQEVYLKEKKLQPRLRLRLENCKNWAQKHHKSASFYLRQLGSESQKQVGMGVDRVQVMSEIKRHLKN